MGDAWGLGMAGREVSCAGCLASRWETANGGALRRSAGGSDATWLRWHHIYQNQQAPQWNPRTRKAENNSSIGLFPSIGLNLEF